MPDVTIERPAQPEQGDFATNFALRAKRAVGPARAEPDGHRRRRSRPRLRRTRRRSWRASKPRPPGLRQFLPGRRLRARAGQHDPGARARRIGAVARRRRQARAGRVRQRQSDRAGAHRHRAQRRAGRQPRARAGARRAGRCSASTTTTTRAPRWSTWRTACGCATSKRSVARSSSADGRLPGRVRASSWPRRFAREHGERFADLPEAQAEELGRAGGDADHASGSRRDLDRARVRFDNWFSEARVIREGDFQRVLDLLQRARPGLRARRRHLAAHVRAGRRARSRADQVRRPADLYRHRHRLPLRQVLRAQLRSRDRRLGRRSPGPGAVDEGDRAGPRRRARALRHPDLSDGQRDAGRPGRCAWASARATSSR